MPSPKKKSARPNATDKARSEKPAKKRSSGSSERASQTSPTRKGTTRFPIVGVGASAGGLEAFTELLKHLPLDTGMGFVLVQHLDPARESALTGLLAKATSLPVREITDGLRVEPNHVYVIPPNANLGITSGVLKLHQREQTRTPHRSVDYFFEALAQDQHECAVGVILSGTATDGTLGMEAIKAEGGITFAQDASARYDSMPRSAAAAGCVDFVLSPEKIAQELARIAKHPYVLDAHPDGQHCIDDNDAIGEAKDETTSATTHAGDAASQEKQHANREEKGFKKILLLVRNHAGVDFSLYKTNTIHRRIQRRMVLSRLETIEAYAQFLRGNAEEIAALYADLLIGVTSFFRNPEAFEFLQRNIFPRILPERRDDPLRIWVLGCSSGQEAYSLAMAYTEFADHAPRAPKLQIFATDLNDAFLEKARAGLYAKNLVADLSPERLRRFFIEEDGGYRVIKPLREAIVFARQNLLSDPPFSRMDLISCRNLLIYIEPSLQKKVMPTFHYALRPKGCLFLGASESIGPFTDLFEALDRKHKFFARKAGTSPTLPARITPSDPTAKKEATTALPSRETDSPKGFHGEISVQREADRVTRNRYAPPSVVVNAELLIAEFRGDTGPYLKSPAGHASFNVLKMAREGLMLPLRAALNKAKKENKVVRRENVRVTQNGHQCLANFEIVPLKNVKERCYLIFFEDAAETKGGDAYRTAVSPPATASVQTAPHTMGPDRREESRRVREIEAELAEVRDYAQSLQEQQDAALEELQASNEEVTSANEELQSINEELETSKEELESSNEELTTVNEEMAHRNAELNRLNGDLVNLQISTKLAIMVLGRDLTIRRFSAQAEKQFKLLATDVGRPISGVRHDLDIVNLEEFVGEVIANVRENEREVRDKEGRWYSLRVRPYLTVDNKVDGAVLVLVDINELKHAEESARAARDYAEATIRTARDPMVVLRADLRVNTANEAFYTTFKTTSDQTEGRSLFEVSGGAWESPQLRALLEDILPRKTIFNDYEVTHEFPQIGLRTMLLNARRLDLANGSQQLILLAIEDVTERRGAEVALRESEERYRTLFDLSPVAVYACDAAGVIQKFNRRAAELWGRKPVPGDTDERFCGSFKLFRPDGSFMPHEQCPMAEVVSGKLAEVRDAEVLIERPDGARITVVVNILPVRNDHGAITGAVNCFYDISGRKQAEEALVQSHRELQSHAEELSRFNRAAVGRELRMIELKKEINEITERHGEPERYKLESEQEENG